MDVFTEARKKLAEQRQAEESTRQELRSRFFSDAVKAAQGKNVRLDYLREALTIGAISEPELTQIPNRAERLVDAFHRSQRQDDLQAAKDQADDAWCEWQKRMVRERDELSAKRRLAHNAYNSAFEAHKEMATIRRDHPEFADCVLGENRSDEKTTQRKKVKS